MQKQKLNLRSHRLPWAFSNFDKEVATADWWPEIIEYTDCGPEVA